MTKDPVCGMQVDEQMAVATTVYQGKLYVFCANPCRQTFEKAAEKYASEGGR